MSIKLYDGFKMKITSWKKILREVHKFREEVIFDLHQKQSKEISKEIFLVYDRAIYLDFPERKDLREIYASVYVDRMIEENRNQYCSISFIPKGKHIFGIIFAQDDLAQKWLQKDFVSRYPYWNNTDRPADVSAKEWKARERTWGIVLGGNYRLTPAEAGFSTDNMAEATRANYVSFEDIEKYQPSLDERAKAVAIEVIFQNWKQKFLAGEKAILGKYYEYVEYLQTEDGKMELEGIKQDVINKISVNN